MRENQVVVPSEASIVATLCLPEGALLDALVPAVALIAGSGADTRDGDLDPPWPAGATDVPAPGTMRRIAHHLAHFGVASLRWDRRGFGASGGSASEADYTTDLADAVACFQWLQGRPEIDGARVGVAGHSAGALVTCRVCRDVPDVAGAALLGALASPIEDMLRWNVGRARRHWDDLTPERQQWLIRELPAQLARAEGIEQLLDAARSGQESVTLEGYGATMTARTARLRQDLSTAYEEEFRYVSCPALVLHGGNDLNVPVADALVTYGKLRAAGNDRVTLAILAGLDHYFNPTSADPLERVWERLSLEGLRRPMAAEALRVITRWFTSTL